jgi:predicted branched-subunit amino acid permease
MRAILLTATPAAAAVGVFGVIYGSLARPLVGTTITVLSSLLIFSGTVQFTIAGLLAAGASPASLIMGAFTVNLRNLLLGAMLRPHVHLDAPRRAGVAWFLLDETAGFALAQRKHATRTMLVSGALLYVSWQIGTVVGLLGAAVEGIASAAEAVFPVLFIALSALSWTSRSAVVRAAAAAILTAVILAVWPQGLGVAAVVAALAVAIPGRSE